MGRIQDAIQKASREKSHTVRPVRSTKEGIDESGHAVSIRGDMREWPARVIDVVEGELREERVVAGLEYEESAAPYRQLRTRVLKEMKDNGWKTLAVTSAHELAGKTLTSVNLAISISRDVNHSVLLVDLDLRTPSVHKKLKFDVEHGLVDFLRGGVELGDVLVQPGYERLFVLPGKSTGRYASEILASPEMKQFMRDIRDDRDASRVIIFDLPPLLRNDDALMITQATDATLLVVEDGVTTEEQLRQSMQMLKGAKLIGVVLNKVRD